MKKIIWATVAVAILTTTFLAGYWYSKGEGTAAEARGERKILHYVDPMNPWQKYDKPGIAPCGMALEPVYEDGANPHSGSLPPGAVMITPLKQQLIGVRTEQVAMSPLSHIVRLLGRIAADETRVYKVNSSVAGWVRRVAAFSTGSIVRKGEVLATFYTPEYLVAQQAYLSALNSSNLRATVRTPGIQAIIAEQSLQQTEDNLRFLGMGEKQIRTLDRNRTFIDNIDIEAPATGLVLSRNISPGLKFDKGAEFYSIADLSRVWVLLDTYGSDAAYFRPGESVQVRRHGDTFEAWVDDVPPQFDPTARTLRVRLAADNPDYLLRPDMFVTVEYPVDLPPALTVPVDAVLDSGLRKTVFIDRGDGVFEPRRIETGKYFGDRVEIAKGLMEGERIVVSGNFLIDSESRFKSPPAGEAEETASADPALDLTAMPGQIQGDGQLQHPGQEAAGAMQGETAMPTGGPEAAEATGVDPICGMTVHEKQAAEAGLTSVHQGKTHFFCSSWCKERFDSAPQNHAAVGGLEMQPGEHHADSAIPGKGE